MTPSPRDRISAASALLQRGDLAAARQLVDRLKAEAPQQGDVWALDGEIALRENRLQQAMVAVDQALELEPEKPERHIQRARCYLLSGCEAQASASALRALEYPLYRLDHLLVLGGVLVRCNFHQKALGVYLQARARDEENADIHRGLASVYRFLGNTALAEESVNRAIALNPEDYEMIGLRSSLRTQTTTRNHIPLLERALAAGPAHWRGAVHLGYALAKEYEDVGENQRSFAALQAAALIKRQHTRYDSADDLKIFPALQSACTAAALRALEGTGHRSSAPIFVLGMPRTGSTLVERIISTHSRVQNIGESSAFPLEMVRLARECNGGTAPNRLDLPALTLQIPMHRLGQRYLDAVAPSRDDSPQFVDKLPLNSLNIGLLHAALPHARIVHVIRHPMDACYAMYKYLFKNGYPFSYQLEELGHYYACYSKLMQHWREVLPANRIFEVHYEDVVADLEGQARGLLEQLDLPWESACAEFHKNRLPSTTGSATQVRRPIYSSSVGLWRAYERQLRPLQEVLEAAGIVVD